MHTIDLKKKKKPKSKYVPSSNVGVKIIPKSEFLSARPLYTEVTYNISELFDKINDMTATSSQYLHSKKVNHNQHNHNVWHTKSVTDRPIDVQILILFNKLTDLNAQILLEEIKEISIYTYNDMKNVVTRIYNKCLTNTEHVSLYAKILRHIMMNYSWIVYDDQCKPVTFRKIFIDRLESDFTLSIDKMKEKQPFTMEMKNNRTAYFNLIGALFKESIIGNQLYRFIFNSIETSFVNTKNSEFIECWVILIKWCNDVWKDDLNEYFMEKEAFVVEHSESFDIKTKILTSDLRSLNCSSTSSFNTSEQGNQVPETKTSDEQVIQDDSYKGYDLMTLVDGTNEYGSLDEWYEVIFGLTDTGDEMIRLMIKEISKETSNLKKIFSLLKFFKKKPEYTEHVIKCVSEFKEKTTCVAYINNAKKLIKK